LNQVDLENHRMGTGPVENWFDDERIGGLLPLDLPIASKKLHSGDLFPGQGFDLHFGGWNPQRAGVNGTGLRRETDLLFAKLFPGP
jgi:hypothetical protein